ncbi:MAG: siderophore-interacting protein [Vibrio sp.]
MSTPNANHKRKFEPKALVVTAIEMLSPNLRRFWFDAKQVPQLADDWYGRYVKLLFTQDGSTDIQGHQDPKQLKMRTYTVAKVDLAKQQLAIDFVCHTPPKQLSVETGGYGAAFAQHAQVGDILYFNGPGVIKGMNQDASWLLMVADLTAVPALRSQIDALAHDAKGQVYLSLPSKQDAPELNLPQGMQLCVLEHPSPEALVEQIKKHPELNTDFSLWCACEFSQMRQIRDLCRQFAEFDLRSSYVSSYWKQGLTEDGHKVAKHQDARELESSLEQNDTAAN